jgi:hypothetical protein
MPRGVRKDKTTQPNTGVSISDQIAENQQQIIETEQALANLKEKRNMLLDLKDKEEVNELFTFIKSSGLSVNELKSKIAS